MATDQGKRPLESRPPTNVLVRVNTNDEAPKFPQTPYVVEIRRDDPDNTAIVIVSALDRDTVVSFLCEEFCLCL